MQFVYNPIMERVDESYASELSKEINQARVEVVTKWRIGDRIRAALIFGSCVVGLLCLPIARARDRGPKDKIPWLFTD